MLDEDKKLFLNYLPDKKLDKDKINVMMKIIEENIENYKEKKEIKKKYIWVKKKLSE